MNDFDWVRNKATDSQLREYVSFNARLRDNLALKTATIEEQKDKIAELTAKVREWLCDECNTVYPGPPLSGLACVICTKCHGDTAPRQSMELRRARQRIAELEAKERGYLGAIEIADKVAQSAINENAKLKAERDKLATKLSESETQCNGLNEENMRQAVRFAAAGAQVELARKALVDAESELEHFNPGAASRCAEVLAQLAPTAEMEEHDQAIKRETAQRAVDLSMTADDYDSWLCFMVQEFGLEWV